MTVQEEKPAARQGKQRLAWDATVCTYTGQGQEKLEQMVREAEILGTITEERQNADRKRVVKESDCKSTDVLYLSAPRVMCLVTLGTGRIALMTRNVSIALCVEAHLHSVEPYTLENRICLTPMPIKDSPELNSSVSQRRHYAGHVLPQNSKAKNYT